MFEKIKNLFLKKKNISLTDSEALRLTFPQFFTDNDYYNSFAYSCINVRAEKVATASPILYEYTAKEKKEITDGTEPFIKLINGYNSFNQSFRDILFLTSISLDLYGKSFLYVPKDFLNRPLELIYLNPQAVNPVFTPEGFIKYFEYRAKTQIINYQSEEIIFFYLPVASQPYQYKSTISALSKTLDIDRLQNEFQKYFYSNNARIDGVLTTDKTLSEDALNRLKKQLRSNYSGSINSGKTMILEGGLSYTATQSTAKEMDFVQSRQAVRDEILSIFRVPKSVLGIADDVNRANAVTGMRTFLQNTIIPFSNHIVSKFNIFIKKAYRETLSLVFDYSIEEDPQIQKEINQLLINSGAITLNELREIYGYGASQDPNANIHIIPNLTKTQNGN